MYTNKKGHPTFKSCIKLQIVHPSPKMAIQFKRASNPFYIYNLMYPTRRPSSYQTMHQTAKRASDY